MDFLRFGGPAQRLISAVGIAAVLLVACGGETPESLQGALNAPISDLDFVDETESSCVSAAVVSSAGFEQLVEAGFATEAIELNPSESLAEILETYDSSELRVAMASCVDADTITRTHLIEVNGADLTCDTDFAGSEMADDLLDLAFDRAGLDDFAIADTSTNRDLLRPCFEEMPFAETFGIDTREELEQAIEAALDGQLRTDDELCAAPLIIDHFGSAEAANEAGITVETPAIFLDDLELERADRSNLLSDIVVCSSLAEIVESEERVIEPSYYECLLDRFDEEFSLTWRQSRVETVFGVDAAQDNANRQRNSALASCVRDRIADVYGSTGSETRVQAQIIAEGAFNQAVELVSDFERFAFTEADAQCAAVEVVRSVDLVRLTELSLTEDPLNPSVELLNLTFAYSEAFQVGYNQCANSALYALAPGFLKNFSAETIVCTDQEIGDAEALLGSYMELLTDLSLDEAQYFRELEILERQLFGPIEQCLASDESEIFDEWMAWVLSDLSAEIEGEPDSLST